MVLETPLVLSVSATKGLICLTELTLENGLSSESEKNKENKISPFQFFVTKTGVMQTQGIYQHFELVQIALSAVQIKLHYSTIIQILYDLHVSGH